jgi:hypothetical protein
MTAIEISCQDCVLFTDFGAKSVTRLSCCRINMGQFAGFCLVLKVGSNFC